MLKNAEVVVLVLRAGVMWCVVLMLVLSDVGSGVGGWWMVVGEG